MDKISLNQQGFTLMELMIVVAIIGILVVIAIPSYQRYTRRAHYAEIIHAALPYRLGVEECYQLTGQLTTCAAGQNGVPPAKNNMNTQQLIHTITVSSQGQIVITPYQHQGITPLDTYVLTPQSHHQQLSWKRSGGAVSAGYVN